MEIRLQAHWFVLNCCLKISGKFYSMIKVVIVDDEIQSRNALRSDIELHCPDLHIAGEAEGVNTAIKTIENLKPDLVFLDINLGDGTGFDLLERLTFKDFKIIFVTAYDKYALKAFQVSAIDFLLKPITSADLVNAVGRFNERFNSAFFVQQVRVLQESMNQIKTQEKKIVLRELETIHFIKVADLVRCESDGPYTHFHMTDGRHLVISRNLKEYDDMLVDYGFIRTHHSHLVNFSKVVRLQKADGGMLVMENGDEIPIAQRKRDYIMEMLKNM